MRPDPSADALVQQGLQALRGGRADRAASLLEQAVRLAPLNIYGRHLLGLALVQDGRLDEGLACLERSLALSPGDAGIQANLTQAYLTRAQALSEAGRGREALADYDRAGALSPTSLGVHAWRGALLLDMGRAAEALAAFDRTLVLAPNLAVAHAGRAKALHALGQLQAALVAADRALALDPDQARNHLTRARVVLALGRPEEGLADCDWAIVLDRDLAEAHMGRADALRMLDRHAEALASGDRALAIDPDHAGALVGRGEILAELGRHAEAGAAFAAALRRQPDFPEAQLGLAFAHLAQGQFDAGWPLLEHRRRVKAGTAGERDLGRPQWRGDADLAGATILLRAEQDLAETLQFCRYVQRVKALGARVVIQAPGPLLSLFASLDGVDRIVEAGEPLPDFDLHCPLPSLPLAFATTMQTIPVDIPYLSADRSAAAAWARRLGPHQALRVGLVWSDAWRAPSASPLDRRRDISLHRLGPLNLEGVEFHSLQLDAQAQGEVRDLAQAGWRGPAIADHADTLADLADTAALIDNLDLVISIDAAEGHLAGAMGKPVWILNRFDAHWRWMAGRADSPWYPSARLFRQRRLGEWDEVVQAVAAALAAGLR